MTSVGARLYVGGAGSTACIPKSIRQVQALSIGRTSGVGETTCVYVHLTVDPQKPCGTLAPVKAHRVDTRAVVPTRVGFTLVDVGFAVSSCETRWAEAAVLRRCCGLIGGNARCSVGTSIWVDQTGIGSILTQIPGPTRSTETVIAANDTEAHPAVKTADPEQTAEVNYFLAGLPGKASGASAGIIISQGDTTAIVETRRRAAWLLLPALWSYSTICTGTLRGVVPGRAGFLALTSI